MSWAFVLALAAGCYATKVLGFLLPQEVLDAPAVRRIAVLAPVGLLASLVLTQTLTTGSSYVLEPRAAGVLVAVVAVLLRASFLVVVLAAIVTAAVVNALTT